MSSLASIKAVIARVFGIGQADAHELVDAAIADAAPILAQARDALTADVKALVDQGTTDAKAVMTAGVADIKAEIAALEALFRGSTPTSAEAAAVAEPGSSTAA
jgi:hypothetical protein